MNLQRSLAKASLFLFFLFYYWHFTFDFVDFCFFYFHKKMQIHHYFSNDQSSPSKSKNPEVLIEDSSDSPFSIVIEEESLRVCSLFSKNAKLIISVEK